MTGYFVYIMASWSKVIYVGVTNDLLRRTAEHRTGHSPGFTKRYRIRRLVYFESFGDPTAAIAREKQLKKWRREKKVALIERANPDWNDLSEEWFGGEPQTVNE